MTVLPVFTLMTLVGCDLSTTADYDQDTDFTSLKTYTWAEDDHPEISDLMHRRIIEVIDEQLQAKGFSQTESDPRHPRESLCKE